MPEQRTFAARRDWLRLALLCALPGVFGPGMTSTANANPGSALAGLRRWGDGEFRRFGLLIYEISLWLDPATPGIPPRPPYALDITYRRTIKGSRLVEASLDEMRKLGHTDEQRLGSWQQTLARLFPDVVPGDRITGQHVPTGMRFFHNDRLLGESQDEDLARAFFAIWLDEKTSAPDLRRALIRPGPAA